MDISVLNYGTEKISIQNVIATVNGSDRSIIEITSPSLKLNRHYNVTLNISNSAGSNTINLILSRLWCLFGVLLFILWETLHCRYS